MKQFSSTAVERRILDHDFVDEVGGYWAHGGCLAMVMRNGGGDQCGHSYDEHPKHWLWHGERFQSADPEGQDFDFHPYYEPEKQRNPANPILVEIRGELERVQVNLLFLITLWMNAIDSALELGPPVIWTDPHHPYHVIHRATLQEREHAMAVLRRYTRFFGEEIL